MGSISMDVEFSPVLNPTLSWEAFTSKSGAASARAGGYKRPVPPAPICRTLKDDHVYRCQHPRHPGTWYGGFKVVRGKRVAYPSKQAWVKEGSPRGTTVDCALYKTCPKAPVPTAVPPPIAKGRTLATNTQPNAQTVAQRNVILTPSPTPPPYKPRAVSSSMLQSAAPSAIMSSGPSALPSTLPSGQPMRYSVAPGVPPASGHILPPILPPINGGGRGRGCSTNIYMPPSNLNRIEALLRQLVLAARRYPVHSPHVRGYIQRLSETRRPGYGSGPRPGFVAGTWPPTTSSPTPVPIDTQIASAVARAQTTGDMKGLVSDLRRIMAPSAQPSRRSAASFVTGSSAIQRKAQSSPIQDRDHFLLADTSDIAWQNLKTFFR